MSSPDTTGWSSTLGMSTDEPAHDSFAGELGRLARADAVLRSEIRFASRTMDPARTHLGRNLRGNDVAGRDIRAMTQDRQSDQIISPICALSFNIISIIILVDWRGGKARERSTA